MAYITRPLPLGDLRDPAEQEDYDAALGRWGEYLDNRADNWREENDDYDE